MIWEVDFLPRGSKVSSQIGFGAVFAQNPGFGAVLAGGGGARSGGRRNDASRLRVIFYGDSHRF